ncbi:MAG: hypothetical protein ACKOC7_03600, partial [Sphingomonadales bacterium]
LYLFNYNGSDAVPTFASGKSITGCFSYKTEFKGELLLRLQAATAPLSYRYIGILDDDQQISVAAINRLLQVASELKADTFQPSVDPASYYSHRRFLQKQGALPEAVGWIEIMSPFLRKAIFDLAAPFYPQSISSYGIDRCVYPYLQRKHNMDRCFLVHEVAVRHLKPVTSGLKLLSNGLDPLQEYERLRSDILRRIATEGLKFSRWELFRTYEVGMPPLFKWRDNFCRMLQRFSGKRP